jgi:putative tricarboxylic transport membrane protein
VTRLFRLLGAVTLKGQRRHASQRRTRLLLLLTAMVGADIGAADAQSSSFYAGKVLKILVGTQVGGTADSVVRGLIPFLRTHLPGKPTIVVQNMTGAGSNMAFNYLAEKASADGLTIVFNAYQALAQALGDPSLHARFENFEYLGGVSDTRVNYMRTDAVPGGMRRPSDLMKADGIIVGAYNSDDFGGMLSRLSLDVLGLKHKMILGYRGGADIFLAMERNEIQFHNTSIGTFRTRSGAFIRSGSGIGLYYHVSVDTNGTSTRRSTEKCRREIPGKRSTGSWPRPVS